MEQVRVPSLGVDPGTLGRDGLTAPAALAVGSASCEDAEAELINLTLLQSRISLIESVAPSLELQLLMAPSYWTWF